MKTVKVFFFIIIPNILFSQDFTLNNNYYLNTINGNFLDTLEGFHTSVKPYRISNETIDKIYRFTKTPLKVGVFNKSVQDKYSFSLTPLANFSVGTEFYNDKPKVIYESSIGFGLRTSYRRKLVVELDFLIDKSKYKTKLDSLQEKSLIGSGYERLTNNYLAYLQGNVNYKINNYFSLQAGYGKFFFGDGYRTLFLSDNANSYPYLSLRTKIWKFDYTALYTYHSDISFSATSLQRRWKGTTTHFLSYNVNKWLNFGFFESVIFEANNNTFGRRFELAYLNPILFLRPVEFSLGSADNVIIGISTKVKIKNKYIFYGQFLIDELVVSRFLKNDGWWGNKHGFQFGFKTHNVAGIKNLFAQMEYNTVRPYTYAHFYDSKNTKNLSNQSFSHYNAPLAHPDGANFYEGILRLNYKYKNFLLDTKFIYTLIGLDDNKTSSVGQNVNLSYTLRPKVANDIFRTTDGLKTTIVSLAFTLNYILNPKQGMMLQLGFNHERFSNLNEINNSNSFFIGFKTALYNRYLTD